MSAKHPAVSVVGIGDDGCAGLSARAYAAICQAQILVGNARTLAFFTDFPGTKMVMDKDVTRLIREIARLGDEHQVTVLASFDPLFFGIGKLLLKAIEPEHLVFLPQPSAAQWAFAKAKISCEDAEVISVHGRPLNGLRQRLRHANKMAVYTDGDNSPQRIGMLLKDSGMHAFRAYVVENINGADERLREFTIDELAACNDIAQLNVLLLVATDSSDRQRPVLPFHSEEAFARRQPKLGLITKREVRILSLAHLGIEVDSVVWDIGAGSGAVAIEAGMLAVRGMVFAIECDLEGVAMCEENIRNFAADNVAVIHKTAPDGLEQLPAPDAVFVGGSKGQMRDIIELAWRRLKPKGRLVVNAITLENVHEAYQAYQALGVTPELTVVNISRGVPLAGKYLRYEALNPIHIFAAGKPA